MSVQTYRKYETSTAQIGMRTIPALQLELLLLDAHPIITAHIKSSLDIWSWEHKVLLDFTCSFH